MVKRKADGSMWRRKKARRVAAAPRRRISRSSVGSLLTHRYKRMLDGDFVNWSTGATSQRCSRISGNAVYAPFLGAFNLNGINNVINATEFTNLYDQFRIDKLIVRFYLKIDPSAQTAATANVPRLYWYRDYDDDTAPANLNEIRENARCKVACLSLYKPVSIVMRPNALQTLYASAVASTYKPVFGQWMDVAVPTARHYGIKLGIDDLTNTNYRVDVEGIVYFSCRQSR